MESIYPWNLTDVPSSRLPAHCHKRPSIGSVYLRIGLVGMACSSISHSLSTNPTLFPSNLHLFKDNSPLMIYLSHPTGPQLCSSTFTHSLILSTGTTDFPPAAKQTNMLSILLVVLLNTDLVWSCFFCFQYTDMPKGLTTFSPSIASWLKLLLFSTNLSSLKL